MIEFSYRLGHITQFVKHVITEHIVTSLVSYRRMLREARNIYDCKQFIFSEKFIFTTMILSDYTTSTTNLSAANESYYFSSVWSSLSSTIPDLMLLCYGSAGPKLVLVHKEILATNSPLLNELFR